MIIANTIRINCTIRWCSPPSSIRRSSSSSPSSTDSFQGTLEEPNCEEKDSRSEQDASEGRSPQPPDPPSQARGKSPSRPEFVEAGGRWGRGCPVAGRVGGRIRSVGEEGAGGRERDDLRLEAGDVLSSVSLSSGFFRSLCAFEQTRELRICEPCGPGGGGGGCSCDRNPEGVAELHSVPHEILQARADDMLVEVTGHDGCGRKDR